MSKLLFFLVPPERGHRKGSVVAYCSSCCCCCCLHTIGGVVGAASALAKEPQAVPEGLEPPRVGGLYWTCVLVVAAPCVLLGAEGGLLVLALGLPLVQLAGSLLAAVYLAIKRPPNAALCQAQLGTVTLWAFLGTVIGFLPMLLLLGALK